MHAAAAPSPVGPRIISIILLAGAIAAFIEVPDYLTGEPALLSLQQLTSGLAALVGAIGAWRLRPWSWIPTLVYGVLSGILVLSVGPLLDLDADARKGLLFG